MCRWTSNFTELDTCANEGALDRYDAASLNAGEGEYRFVISTRLCDLKVLFTHISKARISLYYVTNKGYLINVTFMRVQQPVVPENIRIRIGQTRGGKVTHLDHLRPNLCWAVGHNNSSLLEGSDLVGSST